LSSPGKMVLPVACTRATSGPRNLTLVGGGDHFSSRGVRPLEGDVVGVLGEPGAVGVAIGPAPVVEEVPEEVEDGGLVSGVVLCGLLLHCRYPFELVAVVVVVDAG
jgi:hypothetical protein